MPILFDKAGVKHEVAEQDVISMLSTDAYFMEDPTKPVVKEAPSAPQAAHGFVFIFDVETGERLERRFVDADELVRSGMYSYNQEGASVPPVESTTEDVLDDEKAMPTLTMENTKQEMQDVLALHEVPFRANMDKAELLDAWLAFTDSKKD